MLGRCPSPADARTLTVITGTGRAGTSFLACLLTALGLPTGFNATEVTRELASMPSHAGLERPLPLCHHNGHPVAFVHHGVEVVKSPSYARPDQRLHWLASPFVDEVIVPLRDLSEVASSRARNNAPPPGHKLPVGGFVNGARSAAAQQHSDEKLLAELFYLIALHRKRLTILAYPHHVLNATYSALQLKRLLIRYGVTRARFESMHGRLSAPEYVHSAAGDLVKQR
jgi:hypothetical protein